MSAPAIPPQRDRETLEQLAASQADLVAAVTRHVEWLVDAHRDTEEPLTPAEADRRARAPRPDPPFPFEADQVSWHELSNLMEHEPTRAQDAWNRVKAAAREELQTGLRGARAVERSFSSPYERARYLVILEALTESLAPRGGMEHLLVQQAATAYEQWLRWQQIATQRIEHEGWNGDRDRRRQLENMPPRARERYERDDGWMPPRLSDAEAVEQATAMADRQQRGFLRVLKTLRDMRRFAGPVIVASAGQVNLGGAQVNIAVPDPDAYPPR